MQSLLQDIRYACRTLLYARSPWVRAISRRDGPRRWIRWSSCAMSSLQESGDLAIG